jgi:hypothetical protein
MAIDFVAYRIEALLESFPEVLTSRLEHSPLREIIQASDVCDTARVTKSDGICNVVVVLIASNANDQKLGRASRGVEPRVPELLNCHSGDRSVLPECVEAKDGVKTGIWLAEPRPEGLA